MQLAIAQAQKAHHATWQNPRVGAVVVKDGQVIATGYHHQFGQAHAERDALSKLTPEERIDSTLYVTLEPCCHFGKQPPCTQLIIDSKIKHVVVAQLDPHPIVTGKGVKQLREAGIDVIVDNQPAVAKLNEHYNFFFQNGRPWITLKQAVSLNGAVNAKENTQTSLTGALANQRVHLERADYQGIVVGSQTVLVDNPRLTTWDNTIYPPIRIIMDRRGRTLKHPELKIFDQTAPTWIFTEQSSIAEHKNAKVITLNQVTPLEVVKYCAQQGLQALYVEGGPTLHAAFTNAKLADELITYITPKIMPTESSNALKPLTAYEMLDPQIERLGNDIRIQGRILPCSLD